MDYSHVIKGVRNNVVKSGIGQSFVRTLRFNQTIVWEHWVNESKMGNSLAEDVLNVEMLHLMESFQRYLGDDDYLLDDTVALIRSTSVILSTFRDHRPVAEIEDKCLDDIMSALAWFNEWESSVKKTKIFSI